MELRLSPLLVIIDPPGTQSGMPGDLLEVHTLVSNQGNQGAVINVFFDETSQTLQQWCRSSQERLALDPQQSSEVTFQFQIPFEAMPGTYDYTLVIDAPEHYPEDTPIQYSRQIQVLIKEQTVVRVNDPTFTLKPTTNPSNPAKLKPGEPLQIVVSVNNRSNRVDRFRLSCLDLEADWFTIRYPSSGLEGPGLLSDSSGLELNPATQSQILFQIHPPPETFAGNYSPTLRLHSANSPELVLLDLVYIQIPAVYRLDVELDTILGKVSQSLGQYEVKLANRGNTLRELALSAKTRDEVEICTYQYQLPQVRVLPNKNVDVNLTVKPRNWWRRPLFGAGLELKFQIEVQDLQKLPLSEKLPQGTLVWKARPWWQLLLLILAIIGLLGGLGYIVWLLLKPPAPLEVVSFSPDSDSHNYTYGNKVGLKWEIQHPNQLAKLDLSYEGPGGAGHPESFDFSRGIPDRLKQVCQNQEPILTCNFTTDATQPGDYIFTLKAFPRNGGTAISAQTPKVKIAPKPVPTVVSLELDKNQYTKGDLMHLTWKIQNSDQLSRLKIVDKAEDGTSFSDSYDFSTQNQMARLINTKTKQPLIDAKTKQPLCQITNLTDLICTNVPLVAPKAGRYTFELQAFSQSDEVVSSSKLTDTKIQILPKPFKIVYFKLNNQEEPLARTFKEGESITLSWKVEGEDISVQVSPLGNVNLSGSQEIVAATTLPLIEITVTDQFGHTVKKGFPITIVRPQSPSPSPSPSPSTSLSPSPSPSLSSKATPKPPASPTPSNKGI